jgi:hypothetical protein
MRVAVRFLYGMIAAQSLFPAVAIFGETQSNQGSSTPKQASSVPTASYLIAVIDPKKLMNQPEPCVAITGPTGAKGIPIMGVLPGLELTFTLKPLSHFANPLKVTSTNGSNPTAGASSYDGTQTYTVRVNDADATGHVPGELSLSVAVSPVPDQKLTCSSPVKITVPVLNSKCSGLAPALEAASGTEGSSAKPASEASGSAQGGTPSISTLLGNPAPLTVTTHGSMLYIYSSTNNATTNKAALAQLENAIKLLPNENIGKKQPSNLRQLEMSVPSATTAESLSKLNFPDFTVGVAQTGKLMIVEKQGATCDNWLAVLDAVEKQSLGIWGESPVSRIFYLKAADQTAEAIGATAPKTSTPNSNQNNTQSPGGTPNGSQSPPGAAGNSDGNGKNTDGGGGNGNKSGGGGGGSNSADGRAAATASGNTPSPSGQSPLATPAANTGNATQGGDTNQASATGNAANSTGGNSKTTPSTAPSQELTLQPLEQDLLVFGGEDRKITDAKRVLAMLDLPRPETIINAWVLQTSTTDPQEIGRFDDVARRLVWQNNDELQQGIGRGWKSVREEIQKGDFFDESFYRYLAYRYVGDFGGNTAGAGEDSTARENKGICPRDQYCLGYTALFSPLKPRLTDLLLAIIAAKNPVEVTENAVNAVEGGYTSCKSLQCDALRARLRIEVNPDPKDCKLSGCRLAGSKGRGSTDLEGPDSESAAGTHVREQTEYDIEARWSSCGKRDLERLVKSAGERFLTHGSPPHLQLECFRSAVERLFEAESIPSKQQEVTPADTKQKPSAAQALVRAALADFLFNYKMSQQYPHEFEPYDLTQSADSLNTALAPFIDAFNRDVAAFQDYLNNVVSMAVKCKPCGNATFADTGLVTVRTVSMNPAEVSSTTQSFLDVSTAPDLATLASNILGAKPSGGTGANAPKTAGILNNLTFNEAQVLTGALASFQSSHAQIGRAIDLKVTPRALSGASSTEMDITLKVDDSGTPTRYTGTASQNFNLSRVATHDTTTHVRVDSLSLFEVSAVGAQLTLSKPPFPIILPGVELPYIGSLVGWPRKPAEEFHSSVAIMSALVVPTAADLAYGLAFVDDRIILAPPGVCRRPWDVLSNLPPCKSGAVTTLDEFRSPIRSFHQAKRECIATGGKFYVPVIPTAGAAAQNPLCGDDPSTRLTLSNLTPTL